MEQKTYRLIQLIKDSKPFFSKDWLLHHNAFFEEEYLFRFSDRLLSFYDNVPQQLPLPHFSEEVSPKPEVFFSYFKTVISEIAQKDFRSDKSTQTVMAKAIENAPFEQLLLMMGQRQTPATIKTIEGLPLQRQVLIESCLKPFNDQISVGVRAWEKHIDRSEDSFWGSLKGAPQQKQERLKQIITNIIDQYTWWNTFHHYKHDIVFEIRVESGHGMRWSHKDQALIGFLEPFL